MSSYLITYDLHRPGQDYQSLFDAIKRLTASWWHCLDSTWIIKHTGTATSIRDELTKYIDSGDVLLVVKLNGEAAWYGFSNECTNWLRTGL